MAQDSGSGLFSGLKKLLFQDEPAAPPPAKGPVNIPVQDPAPQSQIPLDDVWGAAPSEAASSADESITTQMQQRVNQLLEQINQPGVDFLELWNAVVEQGQPNAQHLKSAYNTLRFADKSLSKEKVISSGRFYIQRLQDAIRTDVQRKGARMQELETEKAQKRGALQNEVAGLQNELARIQEAIRKKEEELAGLDAQYDEPVAEMRRSIALGQSTVEEMTGRMEEMLRLAEAEL